MSPTGVRKSASRARTLWLALYILVVAAPLVFALVAPRPSARSFAVEVAAALGFGAFTLLALQLVLPARVREFTIKAAGDFTSALHTLRPGTKMLVDGPHGSFEARPGMPLLVVVAGIGITPAMSIVRTLSDTGDPTPVTLVYGSRRWEDTTFQEELAALDGVGGIRVVHVLSAPDDVWSGERGRIDAALLARVLRSGVRPVDAFVCGPPPTVDAAAAALATVGFSRANVHTECF